MAKRLRVVFLYRAAHARSGAKIMRCDQLSEIARAGLSERFDFRVLQLPKPRFSAAIRDLFDDLDGAIVILLKRAHVTLSDNQLWHLRRKTKALIVDHVDASFDKTSLDFADLHIAASLDGKSGLSRIIERVSPHSPAPVSLVLHHADPRITWHDHSHAKAANIAYFGLKEHAAIPDACSSAITVHPYSTTADFAPAFQDLGFANTHYAVRPHVIARNRWKPFTKGITAAAFGANVLVNREVDDALSQLGADYPYLVPDTAAEAVQDGLGRIRRGVGSAEWRYALEIMQSLRARTAPDRIAAQLGHAIARVA